MALRFKARPLPQGLGRWNGPACSHHDPLGTIDQQKTREVFGLGVLMPKGTILKVMYIKNIFPEKVSKLLIAPHRMST